MASAAREKTPTEIVGIPVDFAGELLVGEQILSANCSVTAHDSITDAETTATILVPDSVLLTGSVLEAQVQGGTLDDVHVLTFSTGLTTFGNRYEAKANLLIVETTTAQDWLCDLSDVKRRLGKTDTTDDLLLMDLITQASAYVRHRTGRDLSFHKYTEVIRPDEDQEKLLLSHFPVISIDSVTLREPTSGVTASIDAQYVRYTEDGFVWLIDPLYADWWEFPCENVVAYRAGFRRIPDDIRGAVETIAIWFYRLRTREGLTSERLGDYAYSRRSLSDFPTNKLFELPDEYVEGVIARYKDIRLGVSF